MVGKRLAGNGSCKVRGRWQEGSAKGCRVMGRRLDGGRMGSEVVIWGQEGVMTVERPEVRGRTTARAARGWKRGGKGAAVMQCRGVLAGREGKG